MSNYFQELNNAIIIDPLLDGMGYSNERKRQGKELRIKCPIHGSDKQTSLAIDIEKKQFYCHNCGAKGDLIQLYADTMRLDIKEAANEIAQLFMDVEAKKVIPAHKIRPPESKQEKNERSYSNEDVEQCWKSASKEGRDTYFAGKGLSNPPIVRFGKNPCSHYGILVPKVNITGDLRGLESISGDRKFQFNTDHNDVRFSLIGELRDGDQIIIGEGIATVQTAWEIYKKKIPAIAVGSKRNLLKVAKIIKEKYTKAQLVVLADLTDTGEPEPEAIEIKKQFPHTIVIKPVFDGLECKGADDINDLISKCGLTMEQAEKQIIEHIANDKIRPAEQTKLDSNFSYLLENNSEEKLIEELKSIAPGIKTGYKIGEVDLAFPGGAISIIAAPTSHGKTTALINFALGILEENPDKNVYFFSYEESAASILVSFLNTWISKKDFKKSSNAPALSKNNKRSIEGHFRGTDEYIKSDMLYNFKQQKTSFFNQIVNPGRLKIFYTNMKANQLVEAVSYINNNDPNAALICIDYMQLLKAEKTRSSRQEELKQVCLMLKDNAVETGLPIVLAAQFNRTVVAEENLSPVNIGEAGDIERIANLIIGMFNRNFDKMSKIGNTGKDGQTREKESKIYFEILKGRNVGAGHSSVMNFDGNKGLILSKSKTESPF